MIENHSIIEADLLRQILETQSIFAKADFDTEAFMQLVVDQMELITPATGAVVELVENDSMIYRAVSGSVSKYLYLKLPILNSISGRSVLEQEIFYVADTEYDNRVNLEACRKISARSLVVAPLIYAGEPFGVLKIVSKKADAFTSVHIQTLEIMAGFIASGLKHQLLFQQKEKLLKERALIIKKLKKTQKRLSDLASHDFLTGLPNRSVFNPILKRAMAKVARSKTFIALMYVDIDHFKSINDNLGHDVGDLLLVKFGARLTKSVRKYDLIVRVGGDEFILLFEDLKTKEDGEKIAEHLIKSCSKSFKLNQKTLDITISVGIAFYDGAALSPIELIKQADTALYKAKHAGRNTYRVFHSKVE